MKKVINHLIQLQDLTVARAEQEASMPGTRVAPLDAAIETLIRELPPDLETQFKRIQRKDMLVVIPIANGICSACGMSLPVSLVNAVRAAEFIHQCPSCGRLLFYPDSVVRGGRRRARRGEPPKIGIERFSAPSLMVPQLASASRDDAIAELSAKLEAEGFVDNGVKLAEKALLREAIVSTTVDNGLAFPHVRGVEGGGLTLALGLSRKGMKFDGSSRKLTRVIFLLVIPTAASAFYLKLLSGLIQTFRDVEAREKLFEADTREKLWKALLKLTRATVT